MWFIVIATVVIFAIRYISLLPPSSEPTHATGDEVAADNQVAADAMNATASPQASVPTLEQPADNAASVEPAPVNDAPARPLPSDQDAALDTARTRWIALWSTRPTA